MDKRVAVHFNFAEHKLSVRQIRQSGSLGSLVDVVDRVALKDCDLTADRDKWESWQSGQSPKVRQFAEVRGAMMLIAPSNADWHEIKLNPRCSPDFVRVDTGQAIEHADFVRIEGRRIFAAGGMKIAA